MKNSKVTIVKNPEKKQKILLNIRLKRTFERIQKEEGFKDKLKQKDLEDIWFSIQKYEKLSKKFGTFYRDYKKFFKKEFPDFKAPEKKFDLKV